MAGVAVVEIVQPPFGNSDREQLRGKLHLGSRDHSNNVNREFEAQHITAILWPSLAQV